MPATTRQINSPPAHKGRRSAERRMPTMCRAAATNVAVCATHRPRGCAPLSGRARLPALRPRLSQGLPSLLSSRPCFLGLGIKRALPALSRPSAVAAPHASAVVPKGMMPEAAPARVASPRGSTALAPHCGSHPECVPRERDFQHVSETETNVNTRLLKWDAISLGRAGALAASFCVALRSKPIDAPRSLQPFIDLGLAL